MDWWYLKLCAIIWIFCTIESQSTDINNIEINCTNATILTPPDECNICKCFDGKIHCTSSICGDKSNNTIPEQLCANDTDVPKPEMCNQCICLEGRVACTDLFCVEMIGCVDGERYPFRDECNPCICKDDYIICTDNDCHKSKNETNVTACKDGQVMPSTSDCEECSCIDGQIKCKKICDLTPTLIARMEIGKACKDGQVMPSTSDCEECSCVDSQVKCNNICDLTPTPMARTETACEDGEKTPSTSDCEECSCVDGQIKCNKICDSTPTLMARIETACKDGEIMPSTSDCEECSCVDGQIKCNKICDVTPTLMARMETACEDGQVMPSTSDCEECSCVDGQIKCNNICNLTSTPMAITETACEDGEVMPSTSDCEECSCVDGQIKCNNICDVTPTLMARMETACEDGQVMPSTSDCEECSCIDGQIKCTKICDLTPTSMARTETACEDGEVMPSTSDCEECSCVDGQIKCNKICNLTPTLMARMETACEDGEVMPSTSDCEECSCVDGQIKCNKICDLTPTPMARTETACEDGQVMPSTSDCEECSCVDGQIKCNKICDVTPTLMARMETACEDGEVMPSTSDCEECSCVDGQIKCNKICDVTPTLMARMETACEDGEVMPSTSDCEECSCVDGQIKCNNICDLTPTSMARTETACEDGEVMPSTLDCENCSCVDGQIKCNKICDVTPTLMARMETACEDGEVMPSTSDCEECSCVDGQIKCNKICDVTPTLMARMETACEDGQVMPSTSDCEECSCVDGQIKCNNICDLTPTSMARTETVCEDGQVIPSTSDCEECSCVDGQITCKKICDVTPTLMARMETACEDGQVMPSTSDCEECSCVDGQIKCNKICDLTPTPMARMEIACEDGDVMPPTSDCEECSCVDGQIKCKKICDLAPTLMARMETGAGCVSGQDIAKPDECNDCICYGGEIYCTHLPCDNDTRMECTEDQPIYKPDECNECQCVNSRLQCSNLICITGSNCTLGQVIPDPDNCNACTCVDGRIMCTNYRCEGKTTQKPVVESRFMITEKEAPETEVRTQRCEESNNRQPGDCTCNCGNKQISCPTENCSVKIIDVEQKINNGIHENAKELQNIEKRISMDPFINMVYKNRIKAPSKLVRTHAYNGYHQEIKVHSANIPKETSDMIQALAVSLNDPALHELSNKIKLSQLNNSEPNSYITTVDRSSFLKLPKQEVRVYKPKKSLDSSQIRLQHASGSLITSGSRTNETILVMPINEVDTRAMSPMLSPDTHDTEYQIIRPFQSGSSNVTFQEAQQGFISGNPSGSLMSTNPKILVKYGSKIIPQYMEGGHYYTDDSNDMPHIREYKKYDTYGPEFTSNVRLTPDHTQTKSNFQDRFSLSSDIDHNNYPKLSWIKYGLPPSQLNILTHKPMYTQHDKPMLLGQSFQVKPFQERLQIHTQQLRPPTYKIEYTTNVKLTPHQTEDKIKMTLLTGNKEPKHDWINILTEQQKYLSKDKDYLPYVTNTPFYKTESNINLQPNLVSLLHPVGNNNTQDRFSVYLSAINDNPYPKLSWIKYGEPLNQINTINHTPVSKTSQFGNLIPPEHLFTKQTMNPHQFQIETNHLRPPTYEYTTNVKLSPESPQFDNHLAEILFKKYHIIQNKNIMSATLPKNLGDLFGQSSQIRFHNNPQLYGYTRPSKLSWSHQNQMVPSLSMYNMKYPKASWLHPQPSTLPPLFKHLNNGKPFVSGHLFNSERFRPNSTVHNSYIINSAQEPSQTIIQTIDLNADGNQYNTTKLHTKPHHTGSVETFSSPLLNPFINKQITVSPEQMYTDRVAFSSNPHKIYTPSVLPLGDQNHPVNQPATDEQDIGDRINENGSTNFEKPPIHKNNASQTGIPHKHPQTGVINYHITNDGIQMSAEDMPVGEFSLPNINKYNIPKLNHFKPGLVGDHGSVNNFIYPVGSGENPSIPEINANNPMNIHIISDQDNPTVEKYGVPMNPQFTHQIISQKDRPHAGKFDDFGSAGGPQIINLHRHENPKIHFNVQASHPTVDHGSIESFSYKPKLHGMSMPNQQNYYISHADSRPKLDGVGDSGERFPLTFNSADKPYTIDMYQHKQPYFQQKPYKNHFNVLDDRTSGEQFPLTPNLSGEISIPKMHQHMYPPQLKPGNEQHPKPGFLPDYVSLHENPHAHSNLPITTNLHHIPQINPNIERPKPGMLADHGFTNIVPHISNSEEHLMPVTPLRPISGMLTEHSFADMGPHIDNSKESFMPVTPNLQQGTPQIKSKIDRPKPGKFPYHGFANMVSVTPISEESSMPVTPHLLHDIVPINHEIDRPKPEILFVPHFPNSEENVIPISPNLNQGTSQINPKSDRPKPGMLADHMLHMNPHIPNSEENLKIVKITQYKPTQPQNSFQPQQPVKINGYNYNPNVVHGSKVTTFERPQDSILQNHPKVTFDDKGPDIYQIQRPVQQPTKNVPNGSHLQVISLPYQHPQSYLMQSQNYPQSESFNQQPNIQLVHPISQPTTEFYINTQTSRVPAHNQYIQSQSYSSPNQPKSQYMTNSSLTFMPGERPGYQLPNKETEILNGLTTDNPALLLVHGPNIPNDQNTFSKAKSQVENLPHLIQSANDQHRPDFQFNPQPKPIQNETPLISNSDQNELAVLPKSPKNNHNIMIYKTVLDHDQYKPITDDQNELTVLPNSPKNSHNIMIYKTVLDKDQYKPITGDQSELAVLPKAPKNDQNIMIYKTVIDHDQYKPITGDQSELAVLPKAPKNDQNIMIYKTVLDHDQYKPIINNQNELTVLPKSPKNRHDTIIIYKTYFDHDQYEPIYNDKLFNGIHSLNYFPNMGQLKYETEKNAPPLYLSKENVNNNLNVIPKEVQLPPSGEIHVVSPTQHSEMINDRTSLSPSHVVLNSDSVDYYTHRPYTLTDKQIKSIIKLSGGNVPNYKMIIKLLKNPNYLKESSIEPLVLLSYLLSSKSDLGDSSMESEELLKIIKLISQQNKPKDDLDYSSSEVIDDGKLVTGQFASYPNHILEQLLAESSSIEDESMPWMKIHKNDRDRKNNILYLLKRYQKPSKYKVIVTINDSGQVVKKYMTTEPSVYYLNITHRTDFPNQVTMPTPDVNSRSKELNDKDSLESPIQTTTEYSPTTTYASQSTDTELLEDTLGPSHNNENTVMPRYAENGNHSLYGGKIKTVMLPKILHSKYKLKINDGKEDCGEGSEWIRNCHACTCTNGHADCYRIPDCILRPLGELMTCKPYSQFKMGDCYSCVCNGDGVAECDAAECLGGDTEEVSDSNEPKFKKFHDKVKTKIMLKYYEMFKKLPKDCDEYPTCEAGTTWITNCHNCVCKDNGKHECTRIDSCNIDHEMYGKPTRCKPNTKFYPKSTAMPCVECICDDEGNPFCPTA